MVIPVFLFFPSQDTFIDSIFGDCGVSEDAGFGTPVLSAKVNVSVFDILTLNALFDFIRVQQAVGIHQGRNG